MSVAVTPRQKQISAQPHLYHNIKPNYMFKILLHLTNKKHFSLLTSESLYQERFTGVKCLIISLKRYLKPLRQFVYNS